MGYYTGNGVVVGGSSVPSSGGAGSLPRLGRRLFVKKMTTTTTTKYPGVSLAEAQSKAGENNMEARALWESDTTGYFYDIIFPDAVGNTTAYTHSQIGDSNLYELIRTHTVVTATIDDHIKSF